MERARSSGWDRFGRDSVRERFLVADLCPGYICLSSVSLPGQCMLAASCGSLRSFGSCTNVNSLRSFGTGELEFCEVWLLLVKVQSIGRNW